MMPRADSHVLILLGSPTRGEFANRLSRADWSGAGMVAKVIAESELADRQEPAPDLLLIGPSVRNARRSAAALRRRFVGVPVLFLLPEDHLHQFRGSLPFSPELAGAGAIAASTPASEIVRLAGEMLATARRERAVSGMFTQLNTMISSQSTDEEARQSGALEADRQSQLVVAERYLSTLLSHAPTALFASDPQGKLLQLNQAAEHLFGAGVAEASCGAADLFAAEDQPRIRALVDRAAAGEVIKDEEVSLASEGADKLTVELSIAPVIGPSGTVEGLSFGAHDITARLRAERELSALAARLDERVAQRTRKLAEANDALIAEMQQREAAESQVRQMQKLEAIGQLTGGIAHDFNNMLAVVLGGLNLIRRRLEQGETQQIDELLTAMRDGAERAAALTQRLLAFARQQPLSPQPLNANDLVAGMSDLLHRTLGETVHVETVLAAGLWLTRADPSQLENALVNLAVNARDAMPEGGRLTIETANSSVDDAYALEHAVPAGQYVMLAVTDTGAGMTQEIVAKAFEPFFTTKGTGKGTGLGLPQVFGFVKQSGGHVKIYSEPGHGTTVKIYLPRHYGPAQAPEQRASTCPTKGSPSELILVVEDDDRVRELTAAMLRDLGYGVLAAASGAEALRILGETPDVSLLFTDVVMPGMNGRQLADEAVSLRPDLKILFTTGYTRNAIVHNGVLDPQVHLLQKPASLEQLASKLRAVLDQ